MVGLPYEKALIAARLGMKPESFSRAMARLRGLGVYVEGEQVAISDVERLAAYARKREGEGGEESGAKC